MRPDAELDEPGVLRVALPSARNSATKPDFRDATRNKHATGTQRIGLKSLALLALSRNSHATSAQRTPEQSRKTAQHPANSRGDFVAREQTPVAVASLRVARDATAQQVTRTVVKFRLPGGCPNSSCAAIGPYSRARIIAQLHDLHGSDVEVLP